MIVRIAYRIVLLITVLNGLTVAAQSDTTRQANPLKIFITDVASRQSLTDLDLILQGEHDTLYLHVDAVEPLVLELKDPVHYFLFAVKAGYDTVSVEFDNPSDPAELIVEFYLPRPKLSKSEKRQANHYSRTLPEYPCDHCEGFQRIRAGRDEMCVMRFGTFKRGQSTGSSYEFRKLKYF